MGNSQQLILLDSAKTRDILRDLRVPSIAAIDAGTSGVKSTQLLRLGNNRYGILPACKIISPNDSQATGDARIWQPEVCIRLATRALHHESLRADSQSAEIRAIALTSTTSTLVAMQGGDIFSDIPPMRWDDLQAQSQAKQLERVRASSAAFPWMTPVSPDSGIAKALFLQEQHGELLEPEEITILEQWSMFEFLLTGLQVQSEPILARKWGLTVGQDWPVMFRKDLERLLRPHMSRACAKNAINILRAKMLSGRILAPGETIGPIVAALADELQMHRTVSVAAPFDTAAQVLGLGIVHRLESVAISFGTSLGVCAVAPPKTKIAIGPIGPIPDTPIRGTSMVFDGIASCGSAIKYIATQWNVLKDGEPDVAKIERFLRETLPGSNDVKMLPYYNGGRRTSQLKGLRGKIDGLRHGIGAPEVVRALFESIAFIVRQIVEDFEKLLGQKYVRILVGGGPVNNGEFMQLLADVTGREVVISDYRDSSLVGCAMCGAVALGWFSDFSSASRALVVDGTVKHPASDRVAVYNRLYREYRNLFGFAISSADTGVNQHASGGPSEA